MRLVRTMRLGVGGMVVGLAALSPVLAHMPYLLPSVFEATGRKSVTLTASFTEDAFRPEIAMQDAPFEITGPDGRTTMLSPPMLAKEATLVDAPLPADGIYRVSSGQRLGRIGRMYRQDGEWKILGEGKPAPAGTTPVAVRSTTLADAYLARGRPGALGALRPRGRALEIHPLSDPTGYTAGAAARFQVLFDGNPLATQEVTLFRERGFYDGNKRAASARTTADGSVSMTPPDAGRYLMLVRYRPSTPSSGTPMMSYTTTLAFEAI